MTNQQHPITPPPELMRHWSRFQGDTDPEVLWFRIANEAAQWGADQELLACGNYLKQCAAWEEEDVTEFYNYRRPKPPSLKERALEMLENTWKGGHISNNAAQTIRRALEQIDD
jgi:hypothetical protein